MSNLLKKIIKISFHLFIALFLIAYIWLIESRYSLKIIKFGPKQTFAGQDFNVQPSGKSALWFKVDGSFSRSMHLRWDDHKLDVRVNPSNRVVSAYIPNYLYNSPGKHSLYLINNKDQCSSNKVEFSVLNTNKSGAKNN